MPVSEADVDSLVGGENAPPQGVSEADVAALLSDQPPPAEAPTVEYQPSQPIDISPPGESGQLRPAPVHLGKPGQVVSLDPDTYKLTPDQADRAARIGTLFRQSWATDADRNGAMQRFAKASNLKFDVVRENFDELKQSWEASRFDPVKWMQGNEHLANLVLDHPELGATVERDQQLSYLHRAMNFAVDHDPAYFISTHPGISSPEEFRSAFAADIAERNRPRKVTFQQDEESQRLQGGYSVFGEGMLPVPNRLLVPFKRFGEMWDQMGISKMQYELMLRRDTGQDTFELENRLQDARLNAVQRDYNEGPIEQVFTDVAQAAASSLQPVVEDAAPLAAGGAVVVGAGTLAVTKSPAVAGRAALSAASFFGKAGAVYGTFQLESGSAYGDMLDHGLDEPTARLAAKVYGTLAAGIEFASWGPMFKSLGPVGALAQEGSTEAFTKALLHSQGFRAALKNLATEGLAEGGEEFLQDATQQAVEYFARAHQVGFDKESTQYPGIDLGQSLEAGVKGTTGGLGLGIAHAGIGMTTRALFQDRARESRSTVDLLAGFSGSETALADPEAVAEMIAHSNPGLKALFISPEAFVKLYQDAKIDPSAAAQEVLGENGPRLLQEALASGQKLEVPLSAYIDWGNKPGAKVTDLKQKQALAEHTTTDAALPTPALIDEKEIKAQAEKLAESFAKGENAEPETAGEAAFLDAAEKQLATVTGDGAEARQKMQLLRAFARVQSERFGQDANQVFKDMAVLVEAGRVPTAHEILAARAQDLSLDRAEELYRDQNTGIPNELAFKESKPPPNRPKVAHLSVEGIKYINDTVSHDRADLLYRAVAQAMHSVGQDAFKVGGDFSFYTKGDEQAQAVLEKVREALPPELRGFGLSVATGADLEIAKKFNQAKTDQQVREGKRANPRPVLSDMNGPILDAAGEEQVLKAEKPKGLGAVEAKDIAFPETKPQPELAADIKERVRKLSTVDYFNKAYVDPVTGEWTAKGWAALPRKQHVVSIDLSGLRKVNEIFGEKYGDRMLFIVGTEAQQHGGETFDFTHLHGDEYAAQSDDPRALEAFVENLRSRLSELPVEFVEPETGELTRLPIDFHHGFSDDGKLETADADLNARKGRLKKARQAGLERRRGKPAGPQSVERTGEGGAGRAQEQTDRAAAARADDYAEARALIARARSNKGAYEEWFRWAVEKKGQGERPKVSWAVISTMARYGVVDPINGFTGNEAGQNLEGRTIAGDKRKGGDLAARRARAAGIGLVGNAADANDTKTTKPFTRNLFQPAGPETLLYQFPTPEESLAELQREQVFTDAALTLGAKVVDSVESMIKMLHSYRYGAGGSDALAHVIYYRDSTGRIQSTSFSEVKGHSGDAAKMAEGFIRQHSNSVFFAATYDPKRAAHPGQTEREREARFANVNVLEALGINPDQSFNNFGADEALGPSVQPRIETDEDSGKPVVMSATEEGVVEGDVAEIPSSKGLPGQSEAEKALRPAEAMARADERITPEGYTGMVVLKQSPKLASGARGYTQIFNEGMQRLYKVVLNPTADHSTFLHESAHVFLDMLTELAQRPDAPDKVKADFAEVLKWLGAKGPEDLVVKSAAENDPARERHEKWARAFERYLLEGHSPARKLVRMFERFRLWLSRVYRDPRILGAPLSDDIRRVFDRMLATDREIENYQRAMGLEGQPLARDVLGMTPEQYQDYLDERVEMTSTVTRRLDHSAAQDQLREQEAWWKDETMRERERAAAEYEKLPARIAQQTLAGKGELAGHGGTGRILLARELVVQAVGDKAAKKFATTRNESEKVDPDEVADFIGYPTGKAMLEGVLALPGKDAWVKQAADARMQEKHPDVVKDLARLREQVGKGWHDEATEKYFLREWAALRLKASQNGQSVWAAQTAPIEVVQAAAKETVANRTVGRLEVGQALAAEKRAADACLRAAAQQNFAKAFAMKQQQLLNFYIWREMSKAREERDAFVDLAAELSKDSARARLGKASPVYRNAVDTMLEALGLREPVPDNPGAGIDDVVAQMTKDGQVIGIDEQALQQLEVKPKGWKDLTVGEMRAVRDALSSIKAAARGVTTVILDGKRIDKDEAVQRIVDEGGRHLPPLPPGTDAGAETWREWAGGWWNAADGAMLKNETMVHWLGGNDTHSTVFRLLALPLQAAKHVEVDLLRGPIKSIVKAFDAMPRSVRARATELIDGKALFLGHTDRIKVPTRRWQVLMLLLNSGNASNLDRVTEGRGITEQQIRDAAVKVGITKEEYEWVQSVWDACEALKKPAFDLEERDTGIRPEEIQARAFETPFGMYRGGYFPAVYDRRGDSGVGAKQELQSFMDPTFTPIGTARGHLKSRVEGFSDIVSLSPTAIYRHLSQVAHDIAYREAVRSVGQLVTDDRVMMMLRQRLGEGRADTFVQYVKDVGRMRGIEGDAQVRPFLALMQGLRGAMAMSALGGSTPNVIEDAVTGITTAILGSELKAKHLAAGVAAVRGYSVKAMSEAEAQSGELRSRHGQLSRELLSQLDQLISKSPLARGPLRFIKDHAFAQQEIVDRSVSAAIWIAAKRQATEEGEAPDDAVVFADKIVRQLLPSQHVVDTAALLRNKGFIGASLLFFRFWSTAYNTLRRNGPDVLPDASIQGAKNTGMAMGYVFAFSILGSLARGQGPDPSEPWDQWFMRKAITGFAGLFPWAGDLAEMGFADWSGGKKREPRNNSIAGMLASIYELAKKAGDGDKDADQRLRAAIRALGLGAGLPVGQALRTGGYLYDLAAGNIDARGPGDVVGGLVYGQTQQQSANVPTILQDLASGEPPGTGPTVAAPH